MKVSIIIPIYNEERTVESIIQKLERLHINNCKKKLFSLMMAQLIKQMIHLKNTLKITVS